MQTTTSQDTKHLEAQTTTKASHFLGSIYC